MIARTHEGDNPLAPFEDGFWLVYREVTTQARWLLMSSSHGSVRRVVSTRLWGCELSRAKVGEFFASPHAGGQSRMPTLAPKWSTGRPMSAQSGGAPQLTPLEEFLIDATWSTTWSDRSKVLQRERAAE